MTVGEHDRWLGNALQSVPQIEYQLKKQNALSVTKELYKIGAISKEEYAGFLFKELKSCGYYYSKD